MSRNITDTHTGKIVTDIDLMLEYLYVGDYGKRIISRLLSLVITSVLIK